MSFGIESDSFGIVDSFLLPVCKFARASYGYCASKKKHILAMKYIFSLRFMVLSKHLNLLVAPWMLEKLFLIW